MKPPLRRTDLMEEEPTVTKAVAVATRTLAPRCPRVLPWAKKTTCSSA
jgi:hypothetical protein